MNNAQAILAIRAAEKQLQQVMGAVTTEQLAHWYAQEKLRIMAPYKVVWFADGGGTLNSERGISVGVATKEEANVAVLMTEYLDIVGIVIPNKSCLRKEGEAYAIGMGNYTRLDRMTTIVVGEKLPNKFHDRVEDFPYVYLGQMG